MQAPPAVAAIDLTPEGWTKPPTLADLKADFTAAKPSQDAQNKRVKNWLDNLNVEGAAKVVVPKGNSAMVPRIIRRQAEWRYSSLSAPFLSTPDLFDVSPATWEDRKAAIQNGLVLNNQFNTKLNKVKFIDEYVRTAVDEGTVIVEVTWDFQEEKATRKRPKVEYYPDPSMMQVHAELAQMQIDDPTSFMREVPEELRMAHEQSVLQGIPLRPEVLGEEDYEYTKITRNQPDLDICDYRNITIDPSCLGDVCKAQFIIKSFESSKSGLRKDGKYKNIDAIQTTTNSILGEPDHATENPNDFNLVDDARKKFVVYQYTGYWDYDGSGTAKPIVCAWVGNTIIRLEKLVYPDGKLNYVVIQYLPVRKKIHGEPDGHLLEDNQKIAGAVYRGMIDLMGKSANGQTGIRKDALDVSNRRKYDKGLDYEYNAHIDPSVAFYMHKYPEIPASAEFMLQLQNTEAEAITGVQSFAEGMSSGSLGDVAAGVRGALNAASKRELNIMNRLADGIVQIGRKIIAMNSEFLDEKEIVRITNDEFVNVMRDDLAGNIDLRLTITTAEEDNAKAEELAMMLQTIGPNEDPAIRRMIQAEIARLRKMPDLAKKFEEYEPKPDPVQQKLQELEIAKAELEIEELRAKTRKLQTAADLDIAKTGTEQASARQLHSDADTKDLDFVEQESGVHQEREIQLQGAQAHANMKLEVVKAGLKDSSESKKHLRDYLKKSQKK